MKIADVGYYVETPKTKSGNRVIPMSEKVLEAFQRVLNKRKYAQPVILEGYTSFCSLTGTACQKWRSTMKYVPGACKEIQQNAKGSIAKGNDTAHLTPHILHHVSKCRNEPKGITVHHGTF